MAHIEVFLIGLLVAVAVLGTLARALSVPYPILFVLGGAVLGFLPGIPAVELDPDLVLVVFLPPLLYSAAFFSSPRDLKAVLRALSLLSVGLVLVTITVVAVVAQALIEGLPWAAAFALGAIVSPTDPIAATAIARRLGVPHRLVTVIEGESLINDASALIAYRVALAAAVGGGFSLGQAGMRFLLAVVGGGLIGLLVGLAVAAIRRRLDDPPTEITISLLTGYAAYLPAEHLGVSGVLAAVASGLYLGWRGPRIATSTVRLQGFAVWEILTFLINATLFLLIGLQLPGILAGRAQSSLPLWLGYGLLVSGLVIVVRFAWLFTTPYLIRALDRRPQQRARRVGPRPRVVLAWSGMRGAVSLAAALALPVAADGGNGFPQRDLILFVTFCVILVTVVGQGLSMPTLIRRLRIQDDGTEEREEIAARIAVAEAAVTRLDELAAEDWVRADTVQRLRGLHEYRCERYRRRTAETGDHGLEDRSAAYRQLLRHVIAAQRAAVLNLRDRAVISSEVMRKVERDLDLEEALLDDPLATGTPTATPARPDTQEHSPG